MKAFIKILKLQLALILGPRLPNAMRALNPFLLKTVALSSSSVWLLRALGQKPFVQADPGPALEVYEWHDAEVYRINETVQICEIKCISFAFFG